MQERGKKINPKKIPMRESEPSLRRQSFMEVNCGYTPEMARLEAERCLFCKKPLCVQGCPVGIDIPGFIRALLEGDLTNSYRILKASNALPAVCGRVCPQESQCEARCVVGKKGEPVSIGHLERFVGDQAIEHETVRENTSGPHREKFLPYRVAIVGSGPAGIACAQDLSRAGIQVTVFEALHVAGGVLSYGIPTFRLPRKIVEAELNELKNQGVWFQFNQVIGNVFTIDQLLHQKKFSAVFIGTGAGLPKFMGLPGEALNGVMSANEFLTRVNLMHGYEKADTPVGMGKRVAVIGAGNTALDTARTAVRLGAEEVSVIYRRTEKESPARVEELRHAKEEGIIFRWLTNPVRFFGDDEGFVRDIECVQMELGEPDESGRRSPHAVSGSEFRLPVDTVVYALGTVANPIIGRSTPHLKLNKAGYIDVDPENQMTSIPGVFAGGDIVTGAATVILALGAGRRAAKGILKYLSVSERDKKEGTNHGVTMSEVSRVFG